MNFTASTTPVEIATQAVAEVAGNLYPVLGVVFGFALTIAVVFLGYRWVKGFAKGKH